MNVCPELEKRLQSAWSDLHEAIVEDNPGISQIDADEKCVSLIENMAQDFVIDGRVKLQAKQLAELCKEVVDESNMPDLQGELQEMVIDAASEDGASETNQDIEGMLEYLLRNRYKTYEELEDFIDADGGD